MSNGQIWEIRREIDYHSVNFIYYLESKICNEKETTQEFQHVSSRIMYTIVAFRMIVYKSHFLI